MGSVLSFRNQESYRDLIQNPSYDGWKAVKERTFRDGRSNRGRLFVLEIFTEDMIEALLRKSKFQEVYAIRIEYQNFVRGKRQFPWFIAAILRWI